MVTAGLLTLVMGLSLAFIPVVLFRVLRPIGVVLAVGYLDRATPPGTGSGSSRIA